MSATRRLLVAALALAAMPAIGAVRLTFQLNGMPVPVAWPAGSFPIRYAIDQRVAAAFPAGVIDRAFNDWTTVPDARITFQSSGVVSARPGKDGQNSVTYVDDLFRDQNFLALTT